MVNPIVHFEIIGKNPEVLRSFYGQLFGWDASIDVGVAPEISETGKYGFIDNAAKAGQGVPGGIGGGSDFTPHVLWYVGVDDVAAYLDRAERLGGDKVLHPTKKPDGSLVIAHFTDPEGNLIGLAGPQ